MKVTNEGGDGSDKLNKAIRYVSALLLGQKYRRKGVPINKIREIFSKHGISFNQGLNELEKKLYSVGIVIRRIKVRHGSKFYDSLIAIIDPELQISELSMFDRETTGVLGLIFYKNVNGEVKLGDLKKELELIIGNKTKVEEILNKAVKKLVRENIIKVIKGSDKIKLTELGLALSPPTEFLEKIVLNEILKGGGKH